MVDLFASSLNHRCSIYFPTTSDPMVAGVDAMLQVWDNLHPSDSGLGAMVLSAGGLWFRGSVYDLSISHLLHIDGPWGR